MHNLKNVVYFEVSRSLKKWSFWVSLLSFPVLIGIIYGLIFVSAETSSQKLADLNKAEVKNIQVIDNSTMITPELATNLKITLLPNSEINSAKENVKIGNSDLLIVYPKDPSRQKTETYGKEISIFENEKYSTAANTIIKAAAGTQVSSQQAYDIILKNQISTKGTTYKDGEVAPGFERIILPLIFLVIFYLVLIMLSNQMVVSTTEEKENRVTEIILTTIESKTLITGKVISLFILGLIQIIVITLPIAILFTVYSGNISNVATAGTGIDIADNASITVHQFAVGFYALVGGLVMLTGLLVAIGAAVPTAKDANNFLGVVILAMFMPLYVLMAIVTDPASIMVQVLTFFPLSAPVTLMIQNAFGTLTPLTGTVSLTIIWTTAIGSLYLAARIFKYGTLEYSRRLSFKELTNKKYRA